MTFKRLRLLLYLLHRLLFSYRRQQRELSLLAQLAEAEGKVDGCQAKIADLTYKISELERDATLKLWNIERKFVFSEILLLPPLTLPSRTSNDTSL